MMSRNHCFFTPARALRLLAAGFAAVVFSVSPLIEPLLAAQIDLSQRDSSSLVLWEQTIGNQSQTFKLEADAAVVTMGLGLGLGSDLAVAMPVETGAAGTRFVLTGAYTLRIDFESGQTVTDTRTFDDPRIAGTDLVMGGSPVLLSVPIPSGAGTPTAVTLSASNAKIQLVCQASGCDVPSLRALERFTTPALRLLGLSLTSEGEVRAAAVLEIQGAETFSFVTPCTFGLSSNSVGFRTISSSVVVSAGEVIDRMQTDFNITCGPGLSGGSSAISLRPYDGVLSEAPNVAKFSGNDSVGLIYGFNDAEIRACYGTSRPWNTKIGIGALDSQGKLDGTIYWGLCALSPLQAGAFSTVVEIEAWVD